MSQHVPGCPNMLQDMFQDAKKCCKLFKMSENVARCHDILQDVMACSHMSCHVLRCHDLFPYFLTYSHIALGKLFFIEKLLTERCQLQAYGLMMSHFN